MIQCEICKRIFSNYSGLTQHIQKTHNYKKEDYYLEFLNIKNINQKCPFCNKNKKFYGLGVGYIKTCGDKKCSIKQMEITNKEIYGHRCSVWNKDIREEINKENMKKYGCKCPLGNKKIREKGFETILNNFNSLENFYKYIYEKGKKTNLNKRGVENVFQDCEIVKKIKYIKDKKYNDQNYNNRKKAKKTCLENFGFDHPMKYDNYLNKMVNTRKNSIDENGLNSYQRGTIKSIETKRNDIDENGLNSFQRSNNNYKETCLKNFGVYNYSQTKEFKQKSYQTKKKNGTLNSSKQEDEFYKILLNSFKEEDIKKQYFNENLYPFSCDFYIKSKNLYIELNLFWTHGFKPFDGINNEHLRIVELWNKRSNEINFKGKQKNLYLNAINVWTKIDVKKRTIVINNDLNFIEIFNKKYFNNFINFLNNEYTGGYKCLI